MTDPEASPSVVAAHAGRPGGSTKTHALFLSMVAGVLMALAFPYPTLWPLAWVALVPLLVALSEQPMLLGALYGYVFGLVFLGITLRWCYVLIHEDSQSVLLGLAIWAAFTAIEALALAAFGALVAWFMRPREGAWWRPVAVASAWTVIEYLRGVGPYALTWSQLSYSQLPTEVVVQMADVTGAYGVTFVIVLVNATLAEITLWHRWHTRNHTMSSALHASIIGTVVAVAVCLLYGALRLFTLPSLHTDVAAVACVQPNVDTFTKWDQGKLESCVKALEEGSERAARGGAYMIVWPETAVPDVLKQRPDLMARIGQLAVRLHVWLLVGADDRTAQGRLTNAAFLFGPDGTLHGQYDKIHLVPFGEFLPLRGIFGHVGVFDGVPDLEPGSVPFVFETSRFKFGTLICFESTFGELTREFVRNGAQLLVVITNDGWFLRSSAAEHHLAMSAMRAIEERMWIVQCGNTGLTGFIDPTGRVHHETDLYEATEVTERVQPGTLGSVYQHFGDWFVWVTVAALIACLLAGRNTYR